MIDTMIRSLVSALKSYEHDYSVVCVHGLLKQNLRNPPHSISSVTIGSRKADCTLYVLNRFGTPEKDT